MKEQNVTPPKYRNEETKYQMGQEELSDVLDSHFSCDSSLSVAESFVTAQSFSYSQYSPVRCKHTWYANSAVCKDSSVYDTPQRKKYNLDTNKGIMESPSQTPEGLKPRCSIDLIKRRLKISLPTLKSPISSTLDVAECSNTNFHSNSSCPPESRNDAKMVKLSKKKHCLSSTKRNKLQRNISSFQPPNTLKSRENISRVDYSELSQKFDSEDKKRDRTKKTLNSQTLSQKWSMLQTQHLHNKLFSSKENIFQTSLKSQTDEIWEDGLHSQEIEQSYPSYALLEDSDDEVVKVTNARQQPTKYLNRSPSLSFSSEEDLQRELKNTQATTPLFHHNSTINSVFQSYQSVTFNKKKGQSPYTQSIANIQYGSQHNIVTTTDIKGAFPQSPPKNVQKYCNDPHYEDDFCDSSEYLHRKLVDDDGNEANLEMNKGSPYDFSPLDDGQDSNFQYEKKGLSKYFHNNTMFSAVSKHHPSTEILLNRERRFSFMSDMSQSDATELHSPLKDHSLHSLDSQNYTPDGSSLSSLSCWSRNYNNYNKNTNLSHNDQNLDPTCDMDMDDKEKLLISLIKRLQDDPSIILHVDAMNDEYDSFVKELSYNIEESNPFVKTPEDKDGIITGYPKVIRDRLMRKYDSILNEVQNEAKQSTSITDFSLSVDGHNKEVRKALHFVSVIVNAAVKVEENDNSYTGQQAQIPFHSL